jgi:hypothetical protein
MALTKRPASDTDSAMLPALLTFALLIPTADKAEFHELTGKVVHIADGDTLNVLDGANVQHKIRLHGIDAPEKAQAFGTKAKEVLARTEKPLTILPADARHLFTAAARLNVRLACSPDTFLGATLSYARQLVSDVPVGLLLILQIPRPDLGDFACRIFFRRQSQQNVSRSVQPARKSQCLRCAFAISQEDAANNLQLR